MILFLDYDGVLHPDEVHWDHRQGIILRTDLLPPEHANTELFCYMDALEAILSDFPDVQIVLSTSWVSGIGYSRSRRRLSPALRKRVISATYHSKYTPRWGKLSRYEQILDHVGRHQLGLDWLALDDDAVGWPDIAFDNLVLCHGHRGIGDPDTQRELHRRLAGYYKVADIAFEPLAPFGIRPADLATEEWACVECGVRLAGSVASDVSWRQGVCGLCGQELQVTEFRNFRR